MKIVAGEFRGRIIKAPKMRDIRPSTERTREAIFSVLGADVIDAGVADLFCGSGALGIEALSRGAKRVLFVDSSSAAMATAKENIRSLGIENRARFLTMNVLHLRHSYLDKVGIIFADPPYKLGFAARLISLLSLPKYSWNGILVLEHEVQWHYDSDYFKLVKRIDFGDTSVSFLLKLEISPIVDGKDKT
jgi:16S rRNA (guanine(966)-N(2))-methyltransferase RsmD